MSGATKKGAKKNLQTDAVDKNSSRNEFQDVLDKFEKLSDLYEKRKHLKRAREKRERDVELMSCNVFEPKQKAACERHLSDVLTAGGELAGVNAVGDTLVYTIINYIEDE